MSRRVNGTSLVPSSPEDNTSVDNMNSEFNIEKDEWYEVSGHNKDPPLLNGRWTAAADSKDQAETHVNLLAHADDNLDKKVDIEEEKHAPEKADDEYSDWDEESEESVGQNTSNIIAKFILFVQRLVLRSYCWLQQLTHGYFNRILWLVAYAVYFVFALLYEFGSEGSWRLLVCTILGVIIAVRHIVWRLICKFARNVYGQDKLTDTLVEQISCTRFFIKWGLYGLVTGIIIWTLIDQSLDDLRSLRSAAGLFIFCFLCLLFCTHPAKVNWHTVYWGIALQFLTALLVLKYNIGQDAILWIQNRLNEFFANSEAGSKMLFGDSYRDHYMIFGAMPIVFLSNATLTVLYYTGALPFIIRTMGACLSFALDTSPVESMSVAAGIFLEGITAILCFRPYLGKLSKSQLFLLLTSAFASLGGAYIAILASMGISLSYIIPAMLVSAPATFAVCKLMVPETKPKVDVMKQVDVGDQEAGNYTSIIDAAQTGAISMTTLVANLIVVAYVFLAYIEWANHTLAWLGDRVGVPNVSIEKISSKLFYPVAFGMGIDYVDCNRVAMLMGYRITVANIIAFMKMGELKMNEMQYVEYLMQTNNNGSVSYDGDDIILDKWNMTLKNGFLSERSEAVVTYALCGFSSCMTVFITTGILVTLVPHRKRWITRMLFRALIAGNVANCMTGCFASMFY